MNAQLGTATANRADARLTLDVSGPVDVVVRDVWGRDAWMRRSERIGESPARVNPVSSGFELGPSSRPQTGADPAASEASS